MTDWLGIDLGTTYSAAALCRPAAGGLETQVVPLSSRSPATASVLFLAGTVRRWSARPRSAEH